MACNSCPDADATLLNAAATRDRATGLNGTGSVLVTTKPDTVAAHYELGINQWHALVALPTAGAAGLRGLACKPHRGKQALQFMCPVLLRLFKPLERYPCNPCIHAVLATLDYAGDAIRSAVLVTTQSSLRPHRAFRSRMKLKHALITGFLTHWLSQRHWASPLLIHKYSARCALNWLRLHQLQHDSYVPMHMCT
jgi:hypothetical protein